MGKFLFGMFAGMVACITGYLFLNKKANVDSAKFIRELKQGAKDLRQKFDKKPVVDQETGEVIG